SPECGASPYIVICLLVACLPASASAFQRLCDSREVRQNALPLPTLPDKYARRPLDLAKWSPLIFAAGNAARRDHGSVAVDADMEIFGFHYIMAELPRLHQAEKGRLVHVFSVGPDDDPVIGHEPANCCCIIRHHRPVPLIGNTYQFVFDSAVHDFSPLV